jgi:hypothetical protein
MTKEEKRAYNTIYNATKAVLVPYVERIEYFQAYYRKKGARMRKYQREYQRRRRAEGW